MQSKSVDQIKFWNRNWTLDWTSVIICSIRFLWVKVENTHFAYSLHIIIPKAHTSTYIAKNSMDSPSLLSYPILSFPSLPFLSFFACLSLLVSNVSSCYIIGKDRLRSTFKKIFDPRSRSRCCGYSISVWQRCFPWNSLHFTSLW